MSHSNPKDNGAFNWWCHKCPVYNIKQSLFGEAWYRRSYCNLHQSKIYFEYECLLRVLIYMCMCGIDEVMVAECMYMGSGSCLIQYFKVCVTWYESINLSDQSKCHTFVISTFMKEFSDILTNTHLYIFLWLLLFLLRLGLVVYLLKNFVTF